MKMSNIRLELVWLIAASQGAASCQSAFSSEAASADVAPADKSGDERAESKEAKEEDLSDLDRSPDALMTLTCEHGKKTFECDECRYETGFVRVPSCIMKEGLLKTTKAEARRIAVPISLTGEVQFDERRVGRISSQVEGMVSKVYVALGDKVKKGQPLIEIESVAVGEGQAAYLEERGMLSLAQSNFDRVSELKKENIASLKEYLEAKQELDAAKIRTDSAFAKIKRLGTGSAEGGRVVLRAPLDGTVLVVRTISREVVKTEESLMTVGDNTAVWVWADLYEGDIAAVKKGQDEGRLTGSISVKAYPDAAFPGTVDLLSPAMDESSRTVKVRVRVDNTDGRLLAGMFASVKIYLQGDEETLAVPSDAVLEDEGRHFVFVHHHGDYFLRRPVEIGREWEGYTEIEKGIDPSQTVAAEGAFLLKSDVLRSKMGAGCAD